MNIKETQAAKNRQEEFAAALYDVSTCTTEQEILDTVARATRRMTDAALVMVSEPDGEEFRHRAASGDFVDEVEDLGVPLRPEADPELNLFSQVFYTRSPAARTLMVPLESGAVSALSRWARTRDLLYVVGIPLSSHDEVLGVLSIFQKSPTSALSALISDLTAFAHAAASALYARRLMTLLQDQQKQVDVLMRASRELPLVPDVDQLWQRTGDILTQGMGASGGFIIEDPARLPSLHTFGTVRAYEGLLQQMFQETNPRQGTLGVQEGPQVDPRLRTHGIESLAVFPLTLHGQATKTLVGIHSQSRRYFTGPRLHLIEGLLGYVSVSYEVIQLRDQDSQSLIVDPLTKMANRYTIQRCFNSESAKIGDGRSSSMALAVLDLDGFSQINSDQGYGAGDRLLQEIAHIIHRAKDPDAMLGRVGGDEFTILYRNREMAEIRQEIVAIQKSLPQPTRWAVVWCAQGNYRFADWLQRAYQNLSPEGAVVEVSD